MEEKTEMKKHWLLMGFVVLGFIIIGFQLFTNIAKKNKQDERISNKQEEITDTTKAPSDSTFRNEQEDSVWKDTEFMQ